MKNDRAYNYISLFGELFRLMPSYRRKQFWVLFCGMLCVAVIETGTLGIIALFASTLADPNVVMNSEYFHYLREILNVQFLYVEKGVIASVAIMMVIAVVVKNCYKAFIKYWISRYCFRLEAYFGRFLIDGLLHLPYEWHVARNSADIVNVINWRAYMGRQFVLPFIQICNDILLMFIMFLGMLVVQPVISIGVILFVGLTAFFIYIKIRMRLDKISSLVKNYHTSIIRESTMAIHGVKDVKISSKEQAFAELFSDKAIPLARDYARQQFYTIAPVLILEVIGFALLAGSVCLMLFVMNYSIASITGIMTLLAVTAWRVFPAVNRVLGGFAAIRKAMPYLSNQLEHVRMINSNNMVSDSVCILKRTPITRPEKIIFQNVFFKYQNSKKYVLKNLNFSINKGKIIGIIGRSGAGKSTLVDVFTGLLKPSSGKILIDGNLLTKENQPSWVQNIGYVSQFPYIYDGTLASNVAFGCKSEDIDMEKVIECCHKAAMDDFLNELPEHIGAFIGERGVKLSGGQRQRVAIARALYTDPEILVFDEATSSLDSKNEKAILDTIFSLKGRLTLIIITHRLSTVENCDFIIWFSNGRIKMQGDGKKIIKKYREENKLVHGKFETY